MKNLSLIALCLISTSAFAFPINSLIPVVEIEPKQDVFSKFTLKYSLACDLAPGMVTDFMLKTGAQSRALVSGRDGQLVSVFGFGPLTLSQPVPSNGQQQQQKKEPECLGSLNLVSIEDVDSL